MHTGYLQDAERTRTGQTVYQHTSNVHPPDSFIRWRLFEVLNMSRTCQRIRPERTSPDTERIHRMRNGQKTNANGHERTENLTVRYASVSAIRKGLTRPLVRIEPSTSRSGVRRSTTRPSRLPIFDEISVTQRLWRLVWGELFTYFPKFGYQAHMG